MGRDDDDKGGEDGGQGSGVAPADEEPGVSLAALRALTAMTLAPAEARALIARVLEAPGGTATLALGARLAIDRRNRPSWLGGLVLGLATSPRPELWPVLALAADDAVAGAVEALIACGAGASARFLAGCDGERARRLAPVCEGNAGAITVRDELATAQGGLFSEVERQVLEGLEAALVRLAHDVLQPG